MNIKVKHYSNIFQSEKDSSHWKMTEDFGESSTDKTFFRPDISQARASLGSLTANSSGKVGVYDFSDGKDTGEVLQTFLRSKALDQAEIDSAYETYKEYVENLKKSDVEKFMNENKDKESKSLLDSFKDFLSQNGKNSPSNSEIVQNSTKSSQ